MAMKKEKKFNLKDLRKAVKKMKKANMNPVDGYYTAEQMRATLGHQQQ